MVVGGRGLRAGFLASLPLAFYNIITAVTIAGTPPATIVADTAITLILGSILGLLVAGVKKSPLLPTDLPCKPRRHCRISRGGYTSLR